MSTKKRIPKLRFPEFDGEWREVRLGEVARFSKGKGISKSDLSDTGKFECIRYGELYTHYGEVITSVKSRTNLPEKELVFSEENDVIIPASGESSIDIAKASCVRLSGIALSGDLNIIKSNLDGAFLSYCLNGSKRKNIAGLAQGVSVVHLYSAQLKTLLLHFPSLPEQQKIAAFLSRMDALLEQLQRQKVLLEAYKKGVMQQLFSRQLRFRDERGEAFGEWEEKRLGDVVERVTRKNTENEHTFVLTNSATQGIVSQQEYFDKDIANQNNLQGYYVVDVDDFVYNPRISTSAPVGPIKRNKLTKGVMSPLYTVFRFKKGNLDFFEKFFESFVWHRYMHNIANFGARHDRMNITNDDFLKMPIPFPSLPEQQKIATFLQQLDGQIAGVEAQLVQLQAFKRGLLQGMFV